VTILKFEGSGMVFVLEVDAWLNLSITLHDPSPKRATPVRTLHICHFERSGLRRLGMGRKWGKPYAISCHSMPNMRLRMQW
jgi:hypothetical protein